MEGVFKRTSQRALREAVAIPAGWVVISHLWVSDRPERRRTTGKWFKIESDQGRVYRLVRFSPKLKGSPKAGSGELVMDWTAWLRLTGFAEDTDVELNLKFTRSPWWAFPAWMLTHPEPTFVLSGIISLISLALGIVALLGIFPHK